MAVIVIYVDGSMYESLYDVNYEVQSDGLLATSTSPKPSSKKFTYSGVNTLLGYSTSSSAVSPDTNFSVGDTGTISSSVTLYSVQQEPVDITISYKGSTIATMSSSGTKTLETAGTYCEDDITIDYTKTGMTVVETLDPNGGTIVSISGDPVTALQAKTVIPTSQSQTISADSGYDAISEVLVQGDSNLIGSNIASGVSIFGVVGTYEGGGGGVEVDTCTINISTMTGSVIWATRIVDNTIVTSIVEPRYSNSYTIQDVVCGSFMRVQTAAYILTGFSSINGSSHVFENYTHNEHMIQVTTASTDTIRLRDDD